MTEFTERYKSLSNFELWEILAEAKNYQPSQYRTKLYLKRKTL